MNNELMRYSRGDVQPTKPERAVARQAKQMYDDVRLATFQSDGVLAFGGHAMEGLVSLDNLRMHLAGDDPVLHGLLGEVEASTLSEVIRIQRGMVKNWGY